jgi:hypothetical protein
MHSRYVLTFGSGVINLNTHHATSRWTTFSFLARRGEAQRAGERGGNAPLSLRHGPGGAGRYGQQKADKSPSALNREMAFVDPFVDHNSMIFFP